mgnify:CR=1 FL=1
MLFASRALSSSPSVSWTLSCDDGTVLVGGGFFSGAATGFASSWPLPPAPSPVAAGSKQHSLYGEMQPHRFVLGAVNDGFFLAALTTPMASSE